MSENRHKFCDVHNTYIFYAFVRRKQNQYISIQICCSLFYIILKIWFVEKDSISDLVSFNLLCQIFAYIAYFIPLTCDNFWTRPFWNLVPSPIFYKSNVLRCFFHGKTFLTWLIQIQALKSRSLTERKEQDFTMS